MWRADIGRVSSVEFVFEVRKGGSLDSVILNLLRVEEGLTVRRLIIVSNTKSIGDFKREISSSLPQEFRKIVAYFEAKEVLEASQMIRRSNKIPAKLNLTVWLLNRKIVNKISTARVRILGRGLPRKHARPLGFSLPNRTGL